MFLSKTTSHISERIIKTWSEQCKVSKYIRFYIYFRIIELIYETKLRLRLLNRMKHSKLNSVCPN